MPALFKVDKMHRIPEAVLPVTRKGVQCVPVREGGRTVYYPVAANGTHFLKPGTHWAADVPTGIVKNGRKRRKRVYLSSDREAAVVLLAKMLKRREGERTGLIDRTAEHRIKPLAEHLDDWEASLAASGRPEDYIALKLSRVNAAFDECGFVFTPDLAADRLEHFLHQLRTGVRKLSIQTANDYLSAVRQFCRWLVANDRLPDDPFKRLKPGNVKLDPRRRRGEFTPDEVARLLAAAESSPVAFRGIAGPDRSMIYRVALGTGFRAAELAVLTPDSFDLAARPPAVHLPAKATKNRREAVQPIAATLATELRPYLHGKPSSHPVWPRTWATRSADMLADDMKAADIPVQVDGPDGTEVRDFHALRNTFISNIVRTGCDLKQAMTLARHSDPRLTVRTYARVRPADLGHVVDKLSEVGTTLLHKAAK